jgi:hypothetical protein
VQVQAAPLPELRPVFTFDLSTSSSASHRMRSSRLQGYNIEFGCHMNTIPRRWLNYPTNSAHKHCRTLDCSEVEAFGTMETKRSPFSEYISKQQDYWITDCSAIKPSYILFGMPKKSPPLTRYSVRITRRLRSSRVRTSMCEERAYNPGRSGCMDHGKGYGYMFRYSGLHTDTPPVVSILRWVFTATGRIRRTPDYRAAMNRLQNPKLLRPSRLQPFWCSQRLHLHYYNRDYSSAQRCKRS